MTSSYPERLVLLSVRVNERRGGAGSFGENDPADCSAALCEDLSGLDALVHPRIPARNRVIGLELVQAAPAQGLESLQEG